MNRLEQRDFLKEIDFTPEDLTYLLDLSAELKAAKKARREPKFMRDKNIVILFEKDSTRTRCSFEVAATQEGAQVIPVCAKLEAEIAELEGDEKAMFLEDLGIHESGLDRLIKASYTLLGLISYLTSGEDECRAWTITRGTKAPQAAGKIHSDFERGFIRAEVIAYDDLMAAGTMAAAREKGMIRSEGKEYVVKDGDIILFRFNV